MADDIHLDAPFAAELKEFRYSGDKRGFPDSRSVQQRLTLLPLDLSILQLSDAIAELSLGFGDSGFH
jgi:hypothetical protein